MSGNPPASPGPLALRPVLGLEVATVNFASFPDPPSCCCCCRCRPLLCVGVAYLDAGEAFWGIDWLLSEEGTCVSVSIYRSE